MIRRRLSSPWASLLAATRIAGAWPTAEAADVVVRVNGITSSTGETGCTLFPSSASGFPMDSTGARALWLVADAQSMTCRLHAARFGEAMFNAVDGRSVSLDIKVAK